MIHSVALNREILLKIGDQLRVLDDDIVSDAVPDQFVELLARFEPDVRFDIHLGGGGLRGSH
jgi:hypothetical protein